MKVFNCKNLLLNCISHFKSNKSIPQDGKILASRFYARTHTWARAHVRAHSLSLYIPYQSHCLFTA
jgi:hypothetical protein